MSTQDDAGVEFSIVPESNQQHFRLLELPAELLGLLTSENPPTLQFKSSEGPSGHALESNGAFCTADKTYNLRQVSTSNSVYITQPSTISDDSLSQPGLEAIAQSHSTLELQLAKGYSAIAYIKAALPTYTSGGHYDQTNVISKEALFANIPLSEAECEQAWAQLACFELDGCRSLIPSNGMKLTAWEHIFATSSLMKIDITTMLTDDEYKTLTASEEEWPSAIAKAVFRSLSTDPSLSESYHLDEGKCIRCVGQVLLKKQSDRPEKCTDPDSFLKDWANLFPEKWRKGAELRMLEGCYKLDDADHSISYVEKVDHQVPNATLTPDAKSTLGAKRKWHEKFRASKKPA